MAALSDHRVSVFGSHGLVLLHLARQPDCTMREMAAVFGLSERRIARILRDLSEADMISIAKRGKRNVYSINEDAPCLHPSIDNLRLRDVVRAIESVVPDSEPAEAPAERRPAPDRRPTARLLHGLLLPFLVTDSDTAFSLLPAILPLLV